MGDNVHKDPGITLFVRIEVFATAKKWVRLRDIDLVFSKGAQVPEQLGNVIRVQDKQFEPRLFQYLRFEIFN